MNVFFFFFLEKTRKILVGKQDLLGQIMFSVLWCHNKGKKEKFAGSSWKHAVHCVIHRCMGSLFSRMGFSHIQVFSTPNIVTTS